MNPVAVKHETDTGPAAEDGEAAGHMPHNHHPAPHHPAPHHPAPLME